MPTIVPIGGEIIHARGHGGSGVVLRVEGMRVRCGLGALPLGHAEIENLELLAIAAALHHEEVGGLDIAMNDAPRVGSGERTGRLLAQGEHLGG